MRTASVLEHLSLHTQTIQAHAAFKHCREFLDRAQPFMKAVYTCNEFNLPVGGFELLKNCLQHRQSRRGPVCVFLHVSVNECAPTPLRWQHNAECSSESSPLSFQGESHFSAAD